MKRRCTCCDRKLELNEKNFYRNSSGKGGYRSRCKECEKKIKNGKKNNVAK